MKARWTVSSTLESKLDSLAELSSETTNAPQEPDLEGYRYHISAAAYRKAYMYYSRSF